VGQPSPAKDTVQAASIGINEFLDFVVQNKQKKLRGLSPRGNYIPTERLPLVGEVSANFCGVTWSA
jgi:hypothetical protein